MAEATPTVALAVGVAEETTMVAVATVAVATVVVVAVVTSVVVTRVVTSAVVTRFCGLTVS